MFNWMDAGAGEQIKNYGGNIWFVGKVRGGCDSQRNKKTNLNFFKGRPCDVFMSTSNLTHCHCLTSVVFSLKKLFQR